jgi:hypothetical protein
MITLCNVTHANMTSPVAFVSSNTRGRLVSIGVANGMNVHHFDVEINGTGVIKADGVSDVRFHSSQSYGGGEGNNGLCFDSNFDTLHIEIRDGKAPAAETRYWCVFEVNPTNLPMTRSEFIEQWKKDEEDEPRLLDFDDDGNVVHERYYDRSGEELLSVSRGRTRHAVTVVGEDTLRPGRETLSGEIRCIDWQNRPLGFDEGLLPLELRLGSRETVVEELPTDVKKSDDGVYEFEATVPEFIEGTPTDWTLSTQGAEWANYRASFTTL